MIATRSTSTGYPTSTTQQPVAAVPVANPDRGTAVLVGALFLISTATFIVSNALITPLLGATTSWRRSPITGT